MVDETREYIPSEERPEEEIEERSREPREDSIEESDIAPAIEGSGILETDKDITVEEAVEIEACLDPNTEKYYLYTKQDCAGASIAAKYIADSELAKFIDCGCPECNLNGIFKVKHPSTHNGNDGSITVIAKGTDVDPTSTTFGDTIITGTPNYTYVVAPKNNEDAGKGAGAPIGSGAVASTGFTFGFEVKLEQTGATGNPTYATSSAKGYVPAVSTSGASTKGLTAGSYTVYIFDSNSDGSCLFRKTIRLNNPKALAGCTDNNTGTNDGAALNYNINVTIDDGSCVYCRASDGKFVDNSSNPINGSGDIFAPGPFNWEFILNDHYNGDLDAMWEDIDSFAGDQELYEGLISGERQKCIPGDPNKPCYECVETILAANVETGETMTSYECKNTGSSTATYHTKDDCCNDRNSPCFGNCQYPGCRNWMSIAAPYPATDSNNTDGRILIYAGLNCDFINYITNVVDSDGLIDAVFKLELYKLTEKQYKDETISGGTKIGSTISKTINNPSELFSGPDKENYPFTHIFDSLTGHNVTYGRYGIKLFIDDPDDTEIDGCYQVFYVTVPVLACPDEYNENIGTTSDGVTITDSELFIADKLICNATNNYCCDVPPITLQPLGPTNCDGYNIKTVINCSPAASSLIVELLYKQNGTWIVIGTASPLQPTITSFSASWGSNIYGQYGDGDYKIRATSTFTRSDECVRESNRVSFKFPTYGCTDSTALNYNPAAECNDRSCLYPVLGCTDQNATNYDPNATQDDGSCHYAVLGCTDPTANNFNPLATQDDNSCNYDPDPYDPEEPDDTGTGTGTGTGQGGSDGDRCDSSFEITLVGSTDATASSCTTTNDDGTANFTIACLATTKYQFRITPAGGTPSPWYPYDSSGSTLFFFGPQVLDSSNTAGSSYASPLINLSPGGYLIEAVQLLPGTTADTTKCPKKSKPVSIGAAATNCGCTDPAADNYDPTATVDDGSCLYGGCTDPNALNYDPNATYDDGSCQYKIDPYPCIPEGISQVINKLHNCIALNGTNFYNALISGRADDCSIMNVWKLILIDHLIHKVGLDCIYNCADSNTVDVTTLLDCSDVWVEGGIKTGLGDQGHAGSTAIITAGEGTLVTDDVLYFVNTNTLYPGDVIKMDSGNIWIANGPGTATLTPGQGFIAELNNPETAIGQANGMWTQCVQTMKRTSYSDNTNYLDNFITFVDKFCADCGIEDQIGILAPSSSPRKLGSGQRLDGINDIDI